MSRPTVYVETSVVSYLTALGSRDVVLVAQQELTRTWWASRVDFSLFASRFVRDEASAGDAAAARRRLDALHGIPLLDITEDAIQLAARLVSDGGLPAKARVDALHVAVATVHGMDYLLTWNCKHIANASLRGKIEAICKASGFLPTTICTPFELPKD
jgi:predicted nucleic acid-binding protein